jgi:hypothetical protein
VKSLAAIGRRFDDRRDQKWKGPHLCGPSLVELPGIEIGAEMSLNCKYAETHYAKARESTLRDLQIREWC